SKFDEDPFQLSSAQMQARGDMSFAHTRRNPTPFFKTSVKGSDDGNQNVALSSPYRPDKIIATNVKEELKAVLLIVESNMVLQSDWPERELLLTSQLPKHRRISNNVQMLENIETCYNHCYYNNNKKTLDDVPEKSIFEETLNHLGKSLSEACFTDRRQMKHQNIFRQNVAKLLVSYHLNSLRYRSVSQFSLNNLPQRRSSMSILCLTSM
ncbi:hypothetical protein IRJ41_025025, partial [Triplophysa rosa]